MIEILQPFVVQANVADSEVSAYAIRTLLDVNNPAGALVFIFVIGGILVVFIAVLDSMKPPNFPPGKNFLTR